MRKVTLLVSVLFLMATASFAGTSTLTLKRVSLTNVNDAAGLWQYAAGTVFSGTNQVGAYASTSRVNQRHEPSSGHVHAHALPRRESGA